MNKQHLETIQRKVSILLHQPLRHIYRGGSSIFIGFGELVEKDSWYRNEDGKVDVRKKIAGKYQLHIECASRFSCGNEVVIAKRDMFLPNSEIDNQHDFNWDNFNWDVKGNNYFDELVSQYIGEDANGFIVSSITANRLGDLKICFENDFVLELFADISGGEECWRFFEIGSEEHIIVSEQGLENHESEED